MPGSRLFDMLKPFLCLALAAFLTGFASYLALGQPHAPARLGRAAQVSAPATGDWNLPKQI
jgi:hypothetical protein